MRPNRGLHNRRTDCLKGKQAVYQSIVHSLCPIPASSPGNIKLPGPNPNTRSPWLGFAPWVSVLPAQRSTDWATLTPP
ncbi:hypothetical protein RRG08_055565 [Elysia crispata]|uniref:Uncharacterized protein n=1 Tax=Elysia crispata TaxID=231223 RepID=A0AAE1AD50_9GAST|nr:hypothetical protein RRG08_055565 [Elysia crispata]